MNPLCFLGIGCTWETETEAPDPRWNTTKEGLTLEPTYDGEVRHWRVCRQCGKREPLGSPARASRETPSAG